MSDQVADVTCYLTCPKNRGVKYNGKTWYEKVVCQPSFAKTLVARGIGSMKQVKQPEPKGSEEPEKKKKTEEK